jgi:hypothetical protein
MDLIALLILSTQRIRLILDLNTCTDPKEVQTCL